MPGKATNAEVTRRVAAVFRLLVKGANRADILKYAQSQGWNVCDNMVDRYVMTANERLKESARIERDREYGLAVERLTDHYGACQKVQDYKGALAVQKELNALAALYEAPKAAVNPDGSNQRIIIEHVNADNPYTDAPPDAG